MQPESMDLEVSVHTALALLESNQPLSIVVRPYAGLRASVQHTRGTLTFKISQGWVHAPEQARVGLALDLLCKVLRKREPPERAKPFLEAYRSFRARESTSQLNDSLRRKHGRASGTTAQGHIYHLQNELEQVWLEYPLVFSSIEKPPISWSKEKSRSRLGFHEPAFNTLVISKALDHSRVPREVLHYIIYHELLHLKHKVLFERGESLRRTVHPAAFKADERQFRNYHQVQAWLKDHRL